MGGNRSELVAARKSPRCHVNTPLPLLTCSNEETAVNYAKSSNIQNDTYLKYEGRRNSVEFCYHTGERASNLLNRRSVLLFVSRPSNLF